MATYVLVHGGWGGAHSFRQVRTSLQDSGHRVFTPSLTGLGERAHLTGPGVDLTTHVTDLVNHVLYEDLEGIVLLGFSYGGCVITGAVDHLAGRIRHLVFLDALVPADGESVHSLTGQTTGPMRLGDPWLVPPPAREFDDPAEAPSWTRAEPPTRWVASVSRSASRVPWRTTRSPGPTSGRPQTGRTPPAQRSSTPPQRAPGRPPRGTTARSRRTT